MKTLLTCLLISGLIVSKAWAQMDLEKMRQSHEARKPQLDSMRAYPDVKYETLSATNKDGTVISFWWMPQEKRAGTALLVHGFNMNKSYMLARAKVYYNLGYNVIAMDLRARGESGGDKTTSGPEIGEDVTAVTTYYNEHLKKYGSLIAVGYSHGGRAVMFSTEGSPNGIEAIVLESLPYSLTEGFKRTYKIPNMPPIPEGNIDKAFEASAAVPVLLMIGDNDTAITVEEGKKVEGLFKNAQSKMVVFPKAGHDLSLQENYKKTIGEFLRH